MDTFGINKNNRFFWLGRYTERVYQGVLIVRHIQDCILDDISIDINDYSNKLGILSTTFTSLEDFCQRYAFDRMIPESILCSADEMLGNGMVLRELLGSQTLSYLQMTISALEDAAISHSSGVQLQWALDDIMAFRGSYAEFVEEEEVRNTIKSGASIERVSTLLRLNEDQEIICKEIKRLMNRLKKTHIQYDKEKLEFIKLFLENEEDSPNRFELLSNIESLFLI